MKVDWLKGVYRDSHAKRLILWLFAALSMEVILTRYSRVSIIFFWSITRLSPTIDRSVQSPTLLLWKPSLMCIPASLTCHNFRHANNLLQLEPSKKIPPSGWKCERCDLTTNLWLNLTDGSILCGRKFFDGSGGNNHALEHYANTSKEFYHSYYGYYRYRISDTY